MTNISRFINDVVNSSQQEPELNQAATAGMLMEAYARFTAEPVHFEPGDLVVCKPGLSKTHNPGPFIVVDVNHDKMPVINQEGHRVDGVCFGDKYQPDILIGYFDKDKDMCITLAESRRLELYTGPTPETI